MPQVKRIAWFIIFISVLAGCKKDRSDKPVSQSSEKEFASFKIEAALNKDFIKVDIEGLIDEEKINLSIPAGTNLAKLIASFTFKGEKVLVKGVEQQSAKTSNDFSGPLEYVIEAEDGSKRSYSIVVEEKESPELKEGIPHIYIVTEGAAEIQRDYLKGTIKIDGKGVYENIEAATRIKGRGNSTWQYPKKPYKIKLDSKASILGLKEAKEWVLLANYLDETLMLNAVAMKIGQLLEFPYANTMIPIDLTVNGVYRGSYNLTEQVEVGKNRVNIEDGGVLLELDTYFDEEFKFKSNSYDLPVMVKYPELEEYSQTEAKAELSKIKNEFNVMEQAISATSFPNNNYLDYIDADALVAYLLVYNLTDNEEINHPKSTYLHKPKDGKYIMGPLWDFDWAYSYEQQNIYFISASRPLFWQDRPSSGNLFFTRFLKDPKIKALYKQKWIDFKNQSFPDLLTYIDEYSGLITESKKKDYSLWRTGTDFKEDVKKLRSWMIERANYIDSYVASF